MNGYDCRTCCYYDRLTGLVRSMHEEDTEGAESGTGGEK